MANQANEPKPASQPAVEPEKKKYETPVVIELGEVSQGTGGFCRNGTAVGGTCATGPANVDCASGSTAP